ncbi:hypothetical protein JXR93_02235, partial [bacterium]|nr:hypothetical protein [bacterium]
MMRVFYFLLFVYIFFSCTNSKNIKDTKDITIIEIDDSEELKNHENSEDNQKKIEDKKNSDLLKKHTTLGSLYSPQHTIVVVLPLSGEREKVGLRFKESIELVNNYIEKPYKLVFFDSESDMFYRVLSLMELVEKERAKFIIGGLTNDDVTPITSVASYFDIPFFTFASDSFDEIGYRKLYIQSITIENISYSVAKYALEELFIRKFGLFYPFNESGFQYLKYFTNFVTSGGGEVVISVPIDLREKNWDKSVSKLVDRDNPYKRGDFLKKIKKYENIESKYWKERYIEREKMKLKPKYEFEAIFAPIPASKVNYIIPLFAAWDIPLMTNDPILMEQIYHKYLNKNQKYVQVFGTPFWYSKTILKNINKYVNGVIFPSPYIIDLEDDTHPFNDYISELKRGNYIYEALIFDLMNIIYDVFDQKKIELNQYEGVM